MNMAKWVTQMAQPRRVLTASSVLVLLLLVVLAPGTILAQRTSQLTGTVDLGGAIDDNPYVNRGGLSEVVTRDFSWALTAYPSVGIISSTATSKFTLDYTFGFEQYQSTLDLRSESHRVSGQYEADLNAKWRLRLSDSYTRSPDFTSFLAFRGLTLTPQGILFDFAPVAVRRDGFQNNADLGFDWARSSHSSFSFDVRHSYRQYDDVPGFSSFSDGQTYGARAEFKHKTSARMAWTVGYDVNQFNFDDFEDARNQDVILGVEREVRPSVMVHLKAGPSYAEALPGRAVSNVIVTGANGAEREVSESFLGYNVDFGISQSTPSTTFGLFFRRDNGMTSGIGSVSTAHTLGVDFSRRLGRRLTAKLTTMGYDYTSRFDSPYDYRGITSTLQFEFVLTRYAALTLGGSYHTQESDYVFSDLERRRLFFSLRLSLSDLFKRTVG